MRVRKFAPALGLALGLMTGAAAQAGINDWYTVAVAAARNDTAEVQTLLFAGGNDPDAIDSSGGRTALGYAALFNNVAMAQLLLDHGAHVDARDSFGNSALHWGAEHGSLAVMRLLIAHRATVDYANRQGTTPIMVAAEHAQPAAVRLLVESGADPRKQDFTGRDAFGWAAGKPAIIQALNTKR